MKKLVGFSVVVFLSVFFIAAVNAGPNAAAVNTGEEGQVQKPEQSTQSGKPTPNNKAKLSKRNQAKIKQEEAAKNKRDMIEKANAGSTKQ